MSLRSLTIVTLTVALVSCGGETGPTAGEAGSGQGNDAAIAEAVLQVDTKLRVANEGLDLEGFVSHLAEDFVMAKEGAVMPLDAFSERLAESFSNYDHHVIESEPAKVTVLTPATVVVISSLDWVAVNPEGETVWDGPLAWTAVYEKRAGVWKLTHGHLSWASQ